MLAQPPPGLLVLEVESESLLQGGHSSVAPHRASTWGHRPH